MKVKELVSRLGEMPADADVMFVWDGCCRSGAQFVWLARGGHVAIADFDDVVYDDMDRPSDAPTSEGNRYWRTPPAPEGE